MLNSPLKFVVVPTVVPLMTTLAPGSAFPSLSVTVPVVCAKPKPKENVINSIEKNLFMLFRFEG